MIYKRKWTQYIKLVIDLIGVMNQEIFISKIRQYKINLIKSNIVIWQEIQL